jgi:type IX secretion system PorP/SprF family membrane protein
MANAAATGAITVNGKSIAVVSLVSVAYVALSFLLVGYKVDQLVLVGLFNLAFYASAITRKFIVGFSIFIVYWIIYDYMKAFPNYNYATVHIADLYNTEKHLFGIHHGNTILTPNEYWRFNGKTYLDIICGIFYLCWIPVPMGFAVFLFVKRRRAFLLFLLTFVLVNFIGFIVYYTFPSAPGSMSYYTASMDLKIPQFGGGIGLMFTRSSEGSAYLNKNNIAGVYSYSVGSDDFVLSFGIQAGVTNRTIDWSKLVFNDQIDSRLGYLPGSVSSADSPDFNSKYYFDSGAGVNLVTGNFMIGTVLQHLNQPNESFTGAPAKLPIRYTAHASYRIDLDKYNQGDESEKSYVIPSVVFYKQAAAQSISAGLQYKHRDINFGLWYRSNNGIQASGSGSIVLSAIFDLNISRDGGEKIRVGAAHDMGVGGLNYSNTSGTTEGSLGYQTTLPSRMGGNKFSNSNQCYHFY